MFSGGRSNQILNLVKVKIAVNNTMLQVKVLQSKSPVKVKVYILHKSVKLRSLQGPGRLLFFILHRLLSCKTGSKIVIFQDLGSSLVSFVAGQVTISPLSPVREVNPSCALHDSNPSRSNQAHN